MIKSVMISIFLISLCTTVHAESIRIYEKDYGEKWPLTVSEGILACTGYLVVTFAVNGKVYAVNGRALSTGHPRINEIWKDDEKMIKTLKKALKGEKLTFRPKIDMGPLIEKGLSLCQ